MDREWQATRRESITPGSLIVWKTLLRSDALNECNDKSMEVDDGP